MTQSEDKKRLAVKRTKIINKMNKLIDIQKTF